MESAIANFCISGSLHGLGHLFQRRNHRARLTWLLLIMTSLAACSYYSYRTLKEHLVEIPVTTDIHFETKISLEFPKVLFCPTLPTRERSVQLYESSSELSPLWDLIAVAGINPLYSDFRYHLHKNYSTAFQKRSGIEKLWTRMISGVRETTIENNRESLSHFGVWEYNRKLDFIRFGGNYGEEFAHVG